jgi:hypothetical protein
MARADNGSQTGGAVEVVLASVAVVIAVVALVVALTRDSGSNKSTAVTTTTMSPQQVCQTKLTTFNQQFRILDVRRVQLKNLEQQLNDQLTAELAAHSPNAGATDAAHQATLREQSDIQQRILRLSESRTGPTSC